VSTATAASTGGYNDAMDYLPVPVGYWNCMFPQAGSNKSSGGGDSSFSLSSISQKFGSASDMSKFGGQSFCPTCRCFNSSLKDMTLGNVTTLSPRYGLCYRTNCARPDYLQVGFRRQGGSVSWYRCPAAGGNIYIPGFTGSFGCPIAMQFCLLEKISAVRFKEQPGCSSKNAPCAFSPSGVAISLRLRGLPASAFVAGSGMLTAAAVDIIAAGLKAGVAVACPSCTVWLTRVDDSAGAPLYTAVRRLGSLDAITASGVISGEGAVGAINSFAQNAASSKMSDLFGTSITASVALASASAAPSASPFASTSLSDGAVAGIGGAAVAALALMAGALYGCLRPATKIAGASPAVALEAPAPASQAVGITDTNPQRCVLSPRTRSLGCTPSNLPPPPFPLLGSPPPLASSALTTTLRIPSSPG
jgi:hypothetical protein